MPSPRPHQAHLILAAWEDQPAFDANAERQLLEQANRARIQSGATPLRVDDGLTHAAREHAIAMSQRRELSHQFSGEPELSKRLAAASSLYLVEAAENVASAESAERAHDALMHSVHHRENLLHPSYNVVGIGVVRRGGTIYVVQDFGDSLEKTSTEASETKIGERVESLRAQAKRPNLTRRESQVAHVEACEMSATDSLKVQHSSVSAQAKHIFRYTTLQAGDIPDAVSRAIEDDSVKAYTAGSCFARSKTYPNGIYWVVLTFY